MLSKHAADCKQINSHDHGLPWVRKTLFYSSPANANQQIRFSLTSQHQKRTCCWWEFGDFAWFVYGRSWQAWYEFNLFTITCKPRPKNCYFQLHVMHLSITNCNHWKLAIVAESQTPVTWQQNKQLWGVVASRTLHKVSQSDTSSLQVWSVIFSRLVHTAPLQGTCWNDTGIWHNPCTTHVMCDHEHYRKQTTYDESHLFPP